MRLSDTVIEHFDIEPERRYITLFDYFKMYRDFDRYNQVMTKFKQGTTDQTKLESYVLKLELDPRRKVMYKLSHNHHMNYLMDIFFIIGNPILAKSPLFDRIYRHNKLIPDIADHTIQMWNSVLTEKYKGVPLKKFYNRDLLNMFISTLNFKKLTDMSAEYNELWDAYFSKAVQKVVQYLQSITAMFDEVTDKVPGLSNFDKDLYEFFFEYNVGLELNTDLVTGIYAALKQNVGECVKIGRKLYGSDLTYAETCKKIQSDPSQIFGSDGDIVESHVKCIDTYKKIFIDDRKYNMPTDVSIYSFDDPNLAGGYYYQNIFYLNLSDRDAMRKYDVESLVLHEAIPGHHLQISLSTYTNKNDVDYLTFMYPLVVNGYAEGWALLAEKMHDRTAEDEKQKLLNEYGRLQMNILRTYRVIADIRLHYFGETVSSVKKR